MGFSKEVTMDKRKKFGYIFLSEETSALLSEHGKISIYFNREVAKNISKDFKNVLVCQIDLEDIRSLALKANVVNKRR